MDYVFDGVCEDGLESSRKALNKDGGRLVCFGQGHLIQGTEMGYFGAPLSARYARFQNDFLMPNTARVDIWESFENDPELYKVRVLLLRGCGLPSQTITHLSLRLAILLWMLLLLLATPPLYIQYCRSTSCLCFNYCLGRKSNLK
jgi:hypothetical protein